MEIIDAEDPGYQSFPQQPAATSTTFFKRAAAAVLSSAHIAGLNISDYLHKPQSSPQIIEPSLSSVPFDIPASGFRPTQTGRPSDTSMLHTQTSQTLRPGGTFPNFQTPQSHSTGQIPPHFAMTGQSVFPLPSIPSGFCIPSSPNCGNLHTLPAPMGVPLRAMSNVSSGMNMNPYSDSSASTPRPNIQPPHRTFSEYPGKPFSAVTRPPLLGSTSLSSQQDGNGPPRPTVPPFLAQGGCHGPPPVVAPPFGIYSKEQMQQQGEGPPMGAMQALTEDFSFLSLASLPGSTEPELDSEALPRPLNDDVEPVDCSQTYTMNCNSKYIRLTTRAMPDTQSLASRWHFPLGAVICPLAEAPDNEEVPLIRYCATDLVRCRRCRIYVNPYVTVIDGGRMWVCNFCALKNDVPGHYFTLTDATGKRVDLNERPEFTKGSVEFTASSQYMVRPPMPAVYFFLIDVSLSAVGSGMLEVVAQTIKSCLDSLPGFPRTHIGFITFDSTVHFYNLKSSLRVPQMLVVSDLDDIFVPLPEEDILVNLYESRTVVDAFLDSLSSICQDNLDVESALIPAMQAAVMVMGKLGGKLLIFQSTLPSLGVGHLRLRGNGFHDCGTEREHLLRIYQDPAYKRMAEDCSQLQIAVNVYAFSDKYIDVATLGTLVQCTGGQFYYYPSFNSSIHAEKLRHELTRDLTRETAWEAVMRIRCGKGVRVISRHGNFSLKANGIISLPVVDCDKAIAVQLSLDEAILTSQTVYIQVALLYTSSCGERRIRVHTTAVPVTGDLREMYRQADTGAIVSLMSRLAIEKSLSSKLEEAREMIQQMIVKGLREYRNLYSARHFLVDRLIYPESLKFLLLYGLALYRSVPLRGGLLDVPLDECCAAGHTMMILPVNRLLKFLYPGLVRIDEYLVKAPSKVDEFRVSNLPLTLQSLDSRGLYLYDDGFKFVVWFGQMLSRFIASDLLGVDFARDFSRVTLSENDNETSKKMIALLEKFRDADPSSYQLSHLVWQGDQPREGFVFLTNLLEDQVGGMKSYVDWIKQIHWRVQQKA